MINKTYIKKQFSKINPKLITPLLFIVIFGLFGVAYFPSNRSVTVNLGAFNSGDVSLSWYNPGNGTTKTIGTYSANGTRNLTYPGGYSDAVLIAEVK